MKQSADNRPLRGLFRALTLLFLAAYIGAVVHLWQHNLSETRSSLAYINSMLVQGARTTLKGHELVLRGLGHELVRLGSLNDPELGRELIERMQLIDPGMAGLGLARADGQLVLVSGIGPGEPLPSLGQRPAVEPGHLLRQDCGVRGDREDHPSQVDLVEYSRLENKKAGRGQF